MRKNRAVQVSLVKTNDKNNVDTTPDEDNFPERLALVSHEVKKFMLGVVGAVATYVVLDTGRQLLIETTKK